ncbi:MAG: hypothetical protein RMJ39_10020 [Deltaproteobacteria bacterium]|nr:hypothetical protein [Deltaproteobacteria bacterium]
MFRSRAVIGANILRKEFPTILTKVKLKLVEARDLASAADIAMRSHIFGRSVELIIPKQMKQFVSAAEKQSGLYRNIAALKNSYTASVRF